MASDRIPSRDAPECKTFRQKWQHFMDYIFPWCVGLGILAAVALWLLADALGTEKPDYRIGFVCAQTLTDETVEQLEQAAAQYGADLNRDGRVIVELDQYPLSYTDDYASPYTQMAGVSALSSDLRDVDFVCFIVENPEKFVQSCDTVLTLQGGQPTVGQTAGELTVPWGALAAFAGLDLNETDAALLQGCRVAITSESSASTGRTAEDTALWQALLTGQN